MVQEQPAIGIDLGTTTSMVGYVVNGTPIILPNERGNLSTPSVVAFRDHQTAWVGELARNLMLGRDREKIVAYPKRFIGTDKRYKIEGREYSPSEIAVIILRKLKNLAARYLCIAENEIRKAILTVPAHFNDSQRLAMLKASKLAGFDDIKLVSEPVAVAVAHGYLEHPGSERMLVFDLGGGSLDVTLIELHDGSFYIKGTGGSDSAGGIFFDRALAGFLARRFEELCGIDFINDPVLYQNLINIAERTKIDLSFVEETEVLFPYLIPGNKNKKSYLNVRVSRSHFERITSENYQEIRNTVMDVFKRSSIVPGWVSRVLLAGGASRMPGVRKLLSEIFPPGVRIEDPGNAEKSVVLGASVLAGMMYNPDKLSSLELKNVTSQHLGLEDNDGEMIVIIPRGTPYPLEVTKTFTTAMDNESEVIIHIIQSGDTDKGSRYQSLGQITLKGLPPARAGEPNIPVTFVVDEYGVLKVMAMHPKNGKYLELTTKVGQGGKIATKPERRGTGLRVV